MNRMQSSAKPPKETSCKIEFDVNSELFSTSPSDTSYALFAPLHYEAGYAYPLIVWLHGPAEDERRLTQIMPEISMRNYVAVAPRAPRAVPVHRCDRDSRRWEQTPDQIQQAESRVFGSIEAARRKLHISPQRIFLAGFDTGGTMAFRVAMNHPERFAGVLSVFGPFPTGLNPFGHLVAARRLSVFLAAARRSERYNSDEVCADLRLLHSAGIPMTLRQYPCDHELSPLILRDMDRWIIEQITAEVPSLAESEEWG